MKQAFHLAFRNLWGAGIRTWLNASVLSFAIIIVIFFTGLIDGWNEEARCDGIAWEYADGHLYADGFDINDPFTYLDGYANTTIVEENLNQEHINIAPILMRSVTLYPQGRMLSSIVKGIPANQDVLDLPTEYLKQKSESHIPIIIGDRMAHTLNLKQGDELMMRWRDKFGSYDALAVTIEKIFDTNVPSVDAGQIWMDLELLQKLTLMDNKASLVVLKNLDDSKDLNVNVDGWNFSSQEKLLEPISSIIEAKKSSGIFLYILFLGIGLLAIFDTQVLSIFRRQKEIGTYVALGMTRWQVVRIFTFEGIMYSFFAVIIAAVFGTPLLYLAAVYGYPMPAAQGDMGIIISDVIYPVYGTAMVLKSILSMMIFATLVSFIPARKIAKLNPVLALKGKAM